MVPGAAVYDCGMSTSFVLGLITVVALVMCSRLLLRGLPLRSVAKRLSAGEAMVFGLGLVGLAFHCGSMFFTGLVLAIPGAQGPTEAVNALGTASMVSYVVPAVLVIAGLRRLHWSGVVSVSIALIAVGVTMYNGGPLDVHLATIFAAVVVFSVVVVALLLSPVGASGRSVSAQPSR